ncbi:hypothetical protein HD554DRAFT_2133845 [Boletus coccyginus]|nr:hypothetical protein HD554DRAFT_2133845 [Boletus coccyginus]
MTMATLLARTLLQNVWSSRWFGCSRRRQRLRESYGPCHLDVASTLCHGLDSLLTTHQLDFQTAEMSFTTMDIFEFEP